MKKKGLKNMALNRNNLSGIDGRTATRNDTGYELNSIGSCEEHVFPHPEGTRHLGEVIMLALVTI